MKMASLHSPGKHEDFLLPQMQKLPSFKVTDVRAGLLFLSVSPFPGVLWAAGRAQQRTLVITLN